MTKMPLGRQLVNENIVDQGLESWIGFLNLEGSLFQYGWMPHDVAT